MAMFNPYRFLAMSDHPVAKVARKAYWGSHTFTLPAPKIITKPMQLAYKALEASYRLPKRVLLVEPLLKAQCKEYGKGVRCDVHVHWINGKGDIILGDNVLLDGKINIHFGARFSEHPTLRVGNNSGISHECSFIIGKEISIGDDCRIAGGVNMFDSSGHPLDPEDRRAGLPPRAEDVRPIHIGNNVWIGRHATIFPGVSVGDNSVISAGAVVMHDVPSDAVVAGNPARVVTSTSPTDARASQAVVVDVQPEPVPAVREQPAPANTAAAADTSAEPNHEAVEKIVSMITTIGKLDGISPDDDYYDAGFSSVRALQLLIELEDEFGATIPDKDFIEARTARALHAMLIQLS